MKAGACPTSGSCPTQASLVEKLAPPFELCICMGLSTGMPNGEASNRTS